MAACTPAPQVEEVQQAAIKFTPRDRGLLWKLEKGGRTSWLYGTIHLGRLEWVVPGPTVMQALRSAGTVALELDLANPGELRALADAPPKRKADSLGPELGERLHAQLVKSCVPDVVSQKLAPAMQLMTVVAAAGRPAGLHPELGIDFIFTSLAARMGKPVAGLETAAEQMSVLVPETAAEEQERVDEALGGLERNEVAPMLARLASAWEAGDDHQLETYEEWCEWVKGAAQRGMLQRMVAQRNPRMADRLASLHEKGSVFAAVGALHTVGQGSLVQLLRERGFKVERIAFDPSPGREGQTQ